MCSETDFTQEKGHFDPTSRIPNSSLLFFEIKVVLSVKESNFNENHEQQ